MKVKFRVKSRKVLAIVLATITIFCSGFKPTTSYAQENNNTRIEEMTNQRKVIDVKRNIGTSEFITINGKSYKARRMQVKASAYTNSPSEGGAYAFNGERLREGHIAADLTVLPLNTKVYIPELNRICTVVDKGSAIKNNKIDIFMNSRQKAMQWGIKNITIYILE